MEQPAELFSLNGAVVTECIIHHIYDGDTFRVSAQFPQFNSPVAFKCRLRGIDTPELRTKNLAEKKLGLLAKTYVIDVIRDIGVKEVKCYKFGKYGRVIVNVTLKDDRDLATCLIEANLGVAYDGKSSRKRADGFWVNLLQQHSAIIRSNL
jgi:micrococcal nuclease